MVATTDDSFITADFIARRVEVLKRFQASTYQGAVSGLGYSHSAAIDVLIVPGAEPLVLELQDFAGACAGGSRPLVSGEDGLRALELLYRISADVENGG